MHTEHTAAAHSTTEQLVVCPVCHHRCRLREGQLGFCRARRATGGEIVSENYGRLTSIAVDPVEKKPLANWQPGTHVLSVGSYGCNLRCPFCQNWEISQADATRIAWQKRTPKELVEMGRQLHSEDSQMIGIAFTYNEPLIGWEFVRDTSILAHEAGLATVLVSNGCADPPIIETLAPLIDAANIDLKSFSPAFYEECGGSLELARSTIQRLAAESHCHLEVTTLVIPGKNDSDEEMDHIASWLASVDPAITLHVTRFFPQWHLTDREPTPRNRVFELAAVARRHLSHVSVGNC